MLHCGMDRDWELITVDPGRCTGYIHQCMLHCFMETGNLSQEIQVGVSDYNTSMHNALHYANWKLITGDPGRYRLQYINACCIGIMETGNLSQEIQVYTWRLIISQRST